jgi:hypothetical protein
LDERTDVHLVEQQSWVMNFRSPRPHLEEMAVFDLKLVCGVAIGTINAETVWP